MKANIWPSITNAQRDGALEAVVKRVGKLPTSKAAVQSLVKIPGLAKYMRNRIEGEPFLVVLSLVADQSSVTGYRWRRCRTSYELDYGVIADFDIIYDEPSILGLYYGHLFIMPWKEGHDRLAIHKKNAGAPAGESHRMRR